MAKWHIVIHVVPLEQRQPRVCCVCTRPIAHRSTAAVVQLRIDGREDWHCRPCWRRLELQAARDVAQLLASARPPRP